jgi:hypothetical protein
MAINFADMQDNSNDVTIQKTAISIFYFCFMSKVNVV